MYERSKELAQSSYLHHLVYNDASVENCVDRLDKENKAESVVDVLRYSEMTTDKNEYSILVNFQ